jgi:hypothetical protein
MEQKFKYSAFRIIVETIDLFNYATRISMNVFSNYISGFRDGNDTFSTTCPQKLWKIQKACQSLVLLILAISVLSASACSTSKGFQLLSSPGGEATVMGKTEDEVKQAVGEPDVVSVTPENLVLWVYMPAWRVVPSPKDTIYVEFDKGKVIKVFKIR